MEKFPSKDGTLLAYQRSGSGSPLVLVHGTGASSTRWVPVLPALEAYFTIYALNRRGRGGSGDTPQYLMCNTVDVMLKPSRPSRAEDGRTSNSRTRRRYEPRFCGSSGVENARDHGREFD